MTKGRPAKANTIYKVGIHNNGGRKYASTQPFTVDENDSSGMDVPPVSL